MIEATPALLPPVLVSADTVAPSLAVLVYAFLAALPRLLAWLLDASRPYIPDEESVSRRELNS